MSAGGKEAIRADDEAVARAEVLALHKQIRELQRVLGKKTLENEILPPHRPPQPRPCSADLRGYRRNISPTC